MAQAFNELGMKPPQNHKKKSESSAHWDSKGKHPIPKAPLEINRLAI
jgi:hypothetical protein